jgi:hypothetical protein
MGEPTEEPDGRAEPARQRILPDRDICRTTPIEGALTIANCHVDSPQTCPYVIMINKAGLCAHPNWSSFIKPSGDKPTV